MNYEPGTIGNDGRLGFSGARSGAGRGRLWIIVLIAVAVVIALVYFLASVG